MKRFIPYIVIVMLLSPLSLAAQQIMNGNGEVKNLEVVRDNGRVTVNMLIDVTNAQIGKDGTIILTPAIEKGEQSLDLPSVQVMGKRAHMYYLRNGVEVLPEESPYLERVAKRKDRKQGKEQVIAYTAEVGFEPWMRGSDVVIKEGSCGCDRTVISQNGEDPLGRFIRDIYQPQYILSFVEPDPEPIKVRQESHSAYINFFVDKYDIRENYKNNASELASVMNSIKLVDDDKDLTITSITIEGWASPEATEQHNKKLSENRANSLADYVTKKTGIDRSIINAVGCGEDWPGLRREVETANKLLKREEILSIIDEQGISVDKKEQKIKDLYPPTIYERLFNEFYGKLRRNDYRIVYNVRNFNLEEARELVDKNPKLLSLSELYKVAGSYEKGSPEYNHVMQVAAETYPTTVAAAVNHANVLIQNKEYDKAIKVLEKSDKDDARIMNALAYAYAAKGDIQKAKELWEKAAKLDNSDAAHNAQELNKHLETL